MTQHSKKEMRREMRLVLANLDKRWEMVGHTKVCEHLTALVSSGSAEPITDVFAWVPCFPGEVDLAGFLAEMLKTERRVYLPRINSGGQMSFVQIQADWAQGLERQSSGVVQPSESYGTPLDASKIKRSLVVAPGLAFDSRGRRLGRGGGYYDRFLASEAMVNALTVGVCWSMQVVSEVPVDGHDMLMDWVCHERGLVQTCGSLK
jgi:5-formyltetrahydrofolate cyclo-ligase